MTTMKLQTLNASQLLSLHANVSEELRKRGITRSANNPVADYAEHLAAKALSLDLENKSTPGYDATGFKGRRYQIKGRRRTRHNNPTRFSAIRGLDKDNFDYVVGVIFNEDYKVERACLIPRAIVKKIAHYQTHVNGWIIRIGDDLWKTKGVKDITKALKASE